MMIEDLSERVLGTNWLRSAHDISPGTLYSQGWEGDIFNKRRLRCMFNMPERYKLNDPCTSACTWRDFQELLADGVCQGIKLSFVEERYKRHDKHEVIHDEIVLNKNFDVGAAKAWIAEGIGAAKQILCFSDKPLPQILENAGGLLRGINCFWPADVKETVHAIGQMRHKFQNNLFSELSYLGISTFWIDPQYSWLALNIGECERLHQDRIRQLFILDIQDRESILHVKEI